MILKTILLTGYNGFIGSNFIQKFNSKNYNLIGISNKKTKISGITSIKKDIRKFKSTDIKQNISYILHFAALSNVDYCEKHPVKCFNSNVLGTQNMLEFARQKNSKFIFFSTSHVYGIPEKIPIKENHPRRPISVYGGSKLTCETLCETYSRVFGMDISIIRLFSVYGKKQSGNDVISKIISQLNNKNIIQMGNLYPKRDFIYIDDVIDAIDIILKKCKGLQIYNVGSGKSHSILQVCNALKKIAKKNIEIKSIKSKSRKVDINNIVSNHSQLKKLGWKPKVSLDQGLREILFSEPV